MDFFDLFRKKPPPLVEQSVSDMGLMLDTAKDMFRAACAYLLDNEPLTLDLSAQDEIINEKEREIRSALLQHFSINPTDEMVFSLMMMSIVQDAERIGDLAKSIAKAGGLAHHPRSSGHAKVLRTIRDRIVAQFDRTKKGFIESDLAAARKVMEENDEIKLQTTDFIHSLANEKHVTVNEAVVLAMAARMIGRVGSHLSNITSSVALPFDKIRRSPTWADDD